MKKKLLFLSLLCPIILFGQDFENSAKLPQDNDIIANYKRLSSQQLLDTAKYYFNKNSYDSALTVYNLLTKTIPQDADIERKYILQSAYDKMANIYYFFSDYRMAYDFLIKRLFICEKYNFNYEMSNTYNNIGIIYGKINQHEMSKNFFLKSLNFYSDSIEMIPILSNLGCNEFNDSAYYYLNKALNISKQYNDLNINTIYSTLGTYYHYKEKYDSAFYYFRLSLDCSIKINDINTETVGLSNIGGVFFEIGNIDSALHYIGLSNKIASENKFVDMLMKNYLTLSEIEASKGRHKNALDLYKTFVNYKDSIYNAGVYGSINLTQNQYEISKKDEIIEELNIIQQIKDNTIHYHRVIQNIFMIAFLLLIIILVVILLQNKKIRTSNNVLVKKNLEIIELKKYAPEPEIIPENSLLQKKESLDISSNKDVSGEEEQNVEDEKQNENRLLSDLSTQSLNDSVSILVSPMNPSSPCDENKDENLTEKDANFIQESQETSNNSDNSINDSCLEESDKIEKHQTCPLSDQEQNELLKRILSVMDEASTFCDKEFSLDKLTKILNSNQTYVSHVINRALKVNFRTFLNSYRIKEAQRLLSELDLEKFTAGSVGINVGFKSISGFYNAFKEVTGISPKFYCKSLQKEEE